MININGATLVNGRQCNVIIKDGIIENVTEHDTGEGDVISIPEGVFISPGWIDLHTHAFPKYEPYCSHPDKIGYKSGVTTVVDAGSCGSDDIKELYEIAYECQTRVLAFLNISRVGLKVRNELADLSYLSFERIYEAFQHFPDMLVGLKARMSASVIGKNGIKPLRLARECANQLNKPLMVHIGSAPPRLQEIVQLLKQGDIITHCFNGKEGNNILDADQTINAEVLKAIKRGVFLDVGHGTSSFSFAIAKKAKQELFHLPSISTDIYEYNRMNGPVYDLATTMNKFLALGYTLEEVVHSVTAIPAKLLNKPQLGTLTKGAIADLTLFTLENDETMLEDSLGNSLVSSVQIKPYAVILGGEYFVCS